MSECTWTAAAAVADLFNWISLRSLVIIICISAFIPSTPPITSPDQTFNKHFLLITTLLSLRGCSSLRGRDICTRAVISSTHPLWIFREQFHIPRHGLSGGDEWMGGWRCKGIIRRGLWNAVEYPYENLLDWLTSSLSIRLFKRGVFTARSLPKNWACEQQKPRARFNTPKAHGRLRAGIFNMFHLSYLYYYL